MKEHKDMEIRETELFIELFEMLITMIEDLKLEDKEKKYRLSRLENLFNNSIQNKKVSGDFLSICHEIKGLHFLKEIFGLCEISQDSKNQSGPDMFTNNTYYELTCLHQGLAPINKLDRDGFVNREFMKYFDLRLTQALESKLNQFRNNTLIDKNRPYVIFISFGEIDNIVYKMDHGIEILRVLLSKDEYFFTIDKASKKSIDSGYTFVDTHIKNNGSQVSRRYFDNKDLSAILVSHATVKSKYSRNNCVLYLNPNSNHQLNPKDFEGMIYWSVDKLGKYKAYINDNELVSTKRLI